LFLVNFFSVSLFAQGEKGKSDSRTTYIRFGYTKESLPPSVLPKDAEVAVDLWMKHLIEIWAEDYVQKTVFFDDLSELVEAVKAGEFDLVSISTLEYFEIRDQIEVTPSFLGNFGDSPTEEYIILTHGDSGITGLSQMRGKKLIIESKIRGKLSLLWLDTLLMKKGLPESEDFFARVDRRDKVSQVILPVFFQKADVCIVTRRAFDAMAELNPQTGQKLKILAASPGFLQIVSCMYNHSSEDIKARMRESYLRLSEEPEGKQALTLFRISKVILFEDRYLEETVRLIDEYKRLKSTEGEGMRWSRLKEPFFFAPH